MTASLISALDVPSRYRISVKPSARSRSATINWGAWQIEGVRIKRTAVVSSGSSAVKARGSLRSPAAPSSERVVIKRRRVCIIGIVNLLPETVIAVPGRPALAGRPGGDPAIQTTPHLLAALLNARDTPGLNDAGQSQA